MDVKFGDEVVGHVTRYCWSPRLEHNIALINVPTAFAATGTTLSLDAGDGWRETEVVDIPWVPAEKVIPAFD
jgi:aminomethyltransferase